MADINKRVLDCDDDCEDGERGERGKRGKRGHRGHDGNDGNDGNDGATGPTGPTGPTGSTGPTGLTGADGPAITLQDEGAPVPGGPQDTFNFVGIGVEVTDAGGGIATITIPGAADPERTLFVAQSWSAPVDPTTHFTSIALAYAASVALTPTADNPVEILVYPGTYTDPIDVVSNVHLIGTDQQRAVIVTGAVTWTPGDGVNLSQTNDNENLGVAFITFTQPWTIDSTLKVAGSSGPVFRGVILAGITYNGQVALDTSIIFASVMQPGVYTFNDIGQMNFYASRTRAMTLSGGTSFNMAGGVSLGTITVNNTGFGFITGEAILAPVNVGMGSSVVISGGVLDAPLTVAVGGAADVRMTNVNSDANLVPGGGTINRTTWIGTAGPTVANVALVVTLTPPFPDALYNVHLQLNAAGDASGVFVTNKQPGQFTIVSPVSDNTFDYTVIHD